MCHPLSHTAKRPQSETSRRGRRTMIGTHMRKTHTHSHPNSFEPLTRSRFCVGELRWGRQTRACRGVAGVGRQAGSPPFFSPWPPDQLVTWWGLRGVLATYNNNASQQKHQLERRQRRGGGRCSLTWKNLQLHKIHKRPTSRTRFVEFLQALIFIGDINFYITFHGSLGRFR